MFELLLNKVKIASMASFPNNLGPGPTTLIGGNADAGFYGEVPSSELLDGVTLASRFNLTAGIPHNTNEPWLKFILDGTILYYAKKTFRYNLHWANLNAVGVVYGNNTTMVNSAVYKVRLPSTALVDPYTGVGVLSEDLFDSLPWYKSEWNRLMYHVSASPNRGSMSSEGISVGDWAQYSDADLGVNIKLGNGTLSFIKETSTTYLNARGAFGVCGGHNTYGGDAGKTHTNQHWGWRPVLELVQ